MVKYIADINISVVVVALQRWISPTHRYCATKVVM
jgi:hypothetical protein